MLYQATRKIYIVHVVVNGIKFYLKIKLTRFGKLSSSSFSIPKDDLEEPKKLISKVKFSDREKIKPVSMIQCTSRKRDIQEETQKRKKEMYRQILG